MGFVLNWADHVLDLRQRTHVMGILNVTPDSFSDGGRYFGLDKAVKRGLDMAREGADIIDVGGESSRPYAQRISKAEEINRIVPVIEALHKELSIPISIDTVRSAVAHEAIKAGASIINDISALRSDSNMAHLAAEAGVPIILMHMKGSPRDMQDDPAYEYLVSEILHFLKNAVDLALSAGIREDLIILDPGIGFGKTFDHNLRIIRDLHRFDSLQRPMLLGTSNKAFIGHILAKDADERDTGSMAAIAASVMKGAHIVRVHNVKKAVETVKMIDAIKRGSVDSV